MSSKINHRKRSHRSERLKRQYYVRGSSPRLDPMIARAGLIHRLSMLFSARFGKRGENG